MFKKIISLMVAVLMVASCAVVAVSAAEQTDSAAAADETSDTAGASNTIYFEVPDNWKNVKQMYAHVYMAIDDGSVKWPAWKTRSEKMTDEGNGKWSYDVTKAGTIDPNRGAAYAVVFAADTGMQTFNLIFGADVLGDTAYVTGNVFENPEDSNKQAIEALWRSGKYGPEKKILSTGKDVVGTQVPAGSTDATIMANWMKVYYADATKTPNVSSLLTKMNVTGQEVYDELVKLAETDENKGKILETSAKLLGVKNTGTSSNSSSNNSSNNSSGNSSNSSSNNSSNGSSSNGSSNSSSGSSGSSSSGSNDAVRSGQDSTILFVLGGVMLAAVAVLFVTRKRED